jgi:hypothetical protein
MKKIAIFILFIIPIGISAQEKFQINADFGALLFGKNNASYSLSAAYNFDNCISVGLDGMLSDKTAAFGVIQKYTAFVDLFSEKSRDYGVSFGIGISYLHSENVLNHFGLDVRAKLYLHLFSNVFLTTGMNNTIYKNYNCLLQLKIGLMYRF